MRKTKLIAAAAALTMICSAVPSFAADSHPSSTLAMYDFEGASNLASTSTGKGEAIKVSSPSATSYRTIATASGSDQTSVDANVAALNALRAVDSTNTVLKINHPNSSDTTKAVLYEGILPKDFVLDFSMLYFTLPTASITISQGGRSYNLVNFSVNSSYLLNNSGSNRFVYYARTGLWYEHSLLFKDFASSGTKLDSYLRGLVADSYELGDFYENIDLSQAVTIEINASGSSDVYFDNIRLYTLNQTIGDTASKDFESDNVSMLPKQNGIQTGGYNAESSVCTDTSGTKTFFNLISYSTKVTTDPQNPSNKVLKSMRGSGANENSYDNAIRFTVNKPDKSLTINFKALTSDGLFNIAADVADGTYKGVFHANNASTPADRIFTLSQEVAGRFVSSGRYPFPEQNASTLSWTADTWNDVSMVYDVETDKTSFNINGVTFDITPNNTILKDMMASTTEDTITISIFQPYPNTESYIMLDDISIVSESNEPSNEITATDAQPLLYNADNSDAGLFWNVTVPSFENTSFINAVFTDAPSEKTLEKTIDVSNFDGPGGGVFSVLLVGAPSTVTAAFTAAE